MIIRDALPADAAAMTAVRAASIRDLCAPDHGGDAATIARWIGPDDKFDKLLAQPDLTLIVVEVDGQIVGLGGVSGEWVVLNYVHPAFRLQGISKAIMQALEARMVAQGIAVGFLDSTATAVQFYQSIGWLADGPFDRDVGQPMQKSF